MTGGDVIRTARKALGLTQAELGAWLEESRWHISQVERGCRPDHEVSDLAAAIGARVGQETQA